MPDGQLREPEVVDCGQGDIVVRGGVVESFVDGDIPFQFTRSSQ